MFCDMAACSVLISANYKGINSQMLAYITCMRVFTAGNNMDSTLTEVFAEPMDLTE